MNAMTGGRKTTTRRHHSAGGAVLARRGSDVVVALIATRQRTRWGLPKGTVDGTETPEETALREVLEETGLRAEILCHLDQINYYFRADGSLISKFVDFYLMRYLKGSLAPQLSEIDDVRWIPLHDAVGMTSFESERKVLERAHQLWTSLEPHERERFASVEGGESGK
jgi:8-oxo-dGTP pyrophosphatase MutT (NUDIX family)